MSNASRLLVVDDDQDLRDTLAEQLGLYDEFQVATAESAGQAIDTVKGDRIDLAIMDVGLPDMDGREAVKMMRTGRIPQSDHHADGQGSESDTVIGLEVGRQRLRDEALQVRGAAGAHPGASAPIRGERGRGLPDRSLYVPARLEASHDEKGSKLKLTEKETAILRYLYRAGQKVVGREMLLAEVWGYNANVTTHTLETHIYRLRQKIETDPSNARILVTEPGGYKLIP